MHGTETQHDTGLLTEAVQWGAQDWQTGARKSECPYNPESWLAEVWKESFRAAAKNASIPERIMASIARMFRTRLF